jgi:D-xylose transport system permease protein
MRQTAVTGILAVGMLLVVLTGQIDLSVGSIVGLIGMTAVVAQMSWHAGLATSILVGILVGLVIEVLQGGLVVYGRIPSLIVTLGGLLVWRGVAKGLSGGNTYPVSVRAFKNLGQAYLSPVFGVLLGIAGVGVIAWLAIRQNQIRVTEGQRTWTPIAFLLRVLGPAAVIAVILIGLNQYAGVPVPVLIFAIVALGAALVLRDTGFGRTLRTAGTAIDVNAASGRNNTLWAFAILGVLAGLVGLIFSARLGSASPDAGVLLEIDAIAACVIGGASLSGGQGTVLGACLGALFMASLDNGMSLRNVPDYVQYIVKGCVLVAAVAMDTIGCRGD